MVRVSYSVGRCLCALLFVTLMGCVEGGSESSSAGVSGSKAKIIKLDHAIYSLAFNELVRIDIREPINPVITDTVWAGNNAQTLTTDGEAIFIGSPGDVSTYRYTVDSGLQHIDSSSRVVTGTDPVIVDENSEYAYSTIVTQERTLSDGSTTGNGALYVYEVDELKNLSEISFYPGIGYAQGLALWQKNLLVCDPESGLLHLDVTDPNLVAQLTQIEFVLCEDIIHMGDGHFITVGQEGIYQLKPIEGNNLAVFSFFR